MVLLDRPTIVCICGSTRFLEEFDAAALRETLAGRIVLSIGSTRVGDEEALDGIAPADRPGVLRGLAELHRAKIRLADEVLVINPGGYVGQSSREEIAYAREIGRPLRFLEPVTSSV